MRGKMYSNKSEISTADLIIVHYDECGSWRYSTWFTHKMAAPCAAIWVCLSNKRFPAKVVQSYDNGIFVHRKQKRLLLLCWKNTRAFF